MKTKGIEMEPGDCIKFVSKSDIRLGRVVIETEGAIMVDASPGINHSHSYVALDKNNILILSCEHPNKEVLIA